ncbi:MAG TPA: pyridoxamine 5'-phosphate oxidase family protein, partial [Burkholderiaceae bacterium]|nr:pyridoxamine 5'-phosphate oxidase family protein [Burkholderiaceae bacterium]
MHIESVEQLRTLYAPAKERARLKQLAEMDVHCRRFIELSPFVVIASSDTRHAMDASPRGGAPGFARTPDS